MKRFLTLLVLSLALPCWLGAETTTNPVSVVNLVNRVCGAGASDHFSFTLQDDFNSGSEAFQLGTKDGRITVTANTLSALTCGLNWYLNHEAHVNIAWNNLTQTPSAYPAPSDTQVHAARGKYRYYLNYCTFSYSMSFWDEDRWMKEVDWMALHGVNLPLQIVGMDAVWYYMLREQFGFSHDEASSFVAGPAFQGWWLMNNLTGHGGKNPEWWYERQAALGKKITDRMRELGMAPCLPGYVGMAPQKYVNDTGVTAYTGSWCGFASPVLIAPGTAYTDMAAQYYAYIQKIFGFMPTSFSIDPAHERGIPGGMDYQAACNAARAAMNAASPGALWVAQEWQVNADQARINALPVENTLLLDLSSERLTYKGRYGAREYLFCMLHNYGGNVGMYGCMMQMLSNYTSHLSTGTANGSNGTLAGVGATPEGIETNPMLYDLLFELPWLPTVPTAEQWLADYTVCRYGIDNANAKEAWENLRTTVYANTSSSQQGCREPVFCSRPNLSGNGASSWAGASYNWDKNKVIEAAEKLLAVDGSGTNYDYDVVDFVRQAITDYAHTLQMDMAAQAPKSVRFAEQADGFLAMMDDVDELLGTLPDFRMGKWAGAARQIAAEAGHAADANWMELNARMLVTTWGNTGAATNQGGLRDYGNREWQGLIRDYYKPRWERYFNDMKANGSCGVTNWAWMAQYELPYVYGKTIGTTYEPANDLYADALGITYPQTYSATPEGNPVEVASAKFAKYFGKLQNGRYYSPNLSYNFTSTRKIVVALKDKNATEVMAALNGIFVTKTAGSSIASYMFDENGNGSFDDTKRTDGSLPSMTGSAVKCQVTTTDGAVITLLANFDGSEVVDDPAWPAVTAKDRDSNAASQYVTNLSVNGTTVYTKSSNLNLADATDGPHIVIDSSDAPNVQPGETVTVNWTGTDGLKYTFLSVYFDKNANQQFEHESVANTECLGYVGSKGAQNTAVCNGSFTFTIPSDMPNGVTCVRLRFDGAWMENNLANCSSNIAVPCLQQGSTATGTAVDPNHATNRTTYDIHLRVGSPAGISDFDATKLYTLKTARGYLPKGETLSGSRLYSTSDADNAGHFRIIYTNGSYHIYNAELQKYLAANSTPAVPYVNEPDGTFRIYPASDVNGSPDKWIIHSDANDKWLMFGGSNQYLNNDGWKTVDAGDQWEIEEFCEPIATPVLTIGGLVFDGETDTEGNATLTTYKSGLENPLTLTHKATANGEEYTVADLTPVFDVLKSVSTPTTVTIASDVESLGEAYPAYVPKRSAGYENPQPVVSGEYSQTAYRWDLVPILSGNCWNLNVKVRFGIKQINKWGICALASGTNPTGSNYTGGFQFYQNSRTNGTKGLTLLKDGAAATSLLSGGTVVYLENCEATFELKYRNGTLRVILYSDNGISIDQSFTTTITSISNLCGLFGGDSEILGLTYNFINEEEGNDESETTWLNNPNITIQPEEGYTGSYDIDANGSLWGSDRRQQLLRVPSAAQLGAGNHFTVPASMLAISPDAFVNNPTAKVQLNLQQYLMIDDLLDASANVSLQMTQDSKGEESLIPQTSDKTFAEVVIADRAISATKWNTLTLPFALDEAACNELFSDVRSLGSVTSIGASKTLNFAKATAMTAGQPYIVKAKAAAGITGITATNTPLAAAGKTQVSNADCTVTMWGNYDWQQGEELLYRFIISNNQFIYVNSDNVSMRGFRAYITLSEEVAEVRSLDIALLGDDWNGEDAIDAPAAAQHTGECHDLTGRRVTQPTRGIYLVNGKKIIMR